MAYPNLPINAIVSGYKDAFDWLHQATARTITVVVEPLRSGCPNHVGFDPITKRAFPVYNSGNPYSSTIPASIPSYGISGILNQPFSGGIACPVCNGEGYLFTPTSGSVFARIQFRNEMTKYELNDTKLQATDFSVRIKVTGAGDIDLLDRAIKVIIDGNSTRKVKEKVPVGLRDIHSYYYYLSDLQ